MRYLNTFFILVPKRTPNKHLEGEFSVQNYEEVIMKAPSNREVGSENGWL